MSFRIRAVEGIALAVALAMPAAGWAQVDSGLGDVNPRELFKPAPGYEPDKPVRRYDFAQEQPKPPVSRSVEAKFAKLRMLDKMTGRVETFEMPVGASETRERLDITLRACRVPPADEDEDAFAYLEIRDLRDEKPRFSGWMFASSPALSALDHARYDVWVLSCSTESAEASSGKAHQSD